MIGADSARPSSVNGVANGVAARNASNSASRKVQTLERIPLVPRPDAQIGTELLHLLLGHQAGVIVLVAGERQTHAFDRVGDEARRLVAQSIGFAKMLDQGFDVVAAQIGHQRAEFGVVQRVDDTGARLRAAQIGQQHLTPRGAALERQRRIQAVRAVIDPTPKVLATVAGERRLQRRGRI